MASDTQPTHPGGVFAIVAAYNEADRIRATLTALASAFPGAPLWVADDGSSDGTARVAEAAGARVVRSERVIGKGGAMTLAAHAALAGVVEDPPHAFGDLTPSERRERERLGECERERLEECERERLGGWVAVLCDGDLGDSAARLGPLVEAVRRGDSDLAVAAFARRVGGGLGLALGFARWAINTRCGLELKAPISGQRALRADLLAEILPFAQGFGMEIGMTIDAARAGARVREIDLDLSHRATGRTVGGFVHRGRQLLDFMRVYLARR
jgi:glycosyltransferase involved in cell wall biosynthesis